LWRELTERDGGGFNSVVIDCELQHWHGQEAMGSGGALCTARLEEKRCAGGRKQATTTLGAFQSVAVAWNSGRGRLGGIVLVAPCGGSEGGDLVWCGSTGGVWLDEGEGPGGRQRAETVEAGDGRRSSETEEAHALGRIEGG
jgi:hypothetical protein